MAECSKLIPFLAAFAAILVTGCGSNTEPGSEPTATQSPSSATGDKSTTEPSVATGELKVGMDAVEAKAIKGPPDSTEHEHGPNGEEFDILTWKDVKATLENE